MRLNASNAGAYLQGLPPDHPARGALLRSWERCKAFTGPAEAAPPFRKVPQDELDSRRRRANAFLQVAEPALDWIIRVLRGETLCGYITDPDGIVLTATGPAHLLEAFRRTPGHDWSERTMGTNGAGTALATGRPVIVAGPDKISAPLHDCTCTGAPVRGPGERIVGAIDICSSVAEAVVGRVSLVALLAAKIERSLLPAPAGSDSHTTRLDARLADDVAIRVEAAKIRLSTEMEKRGLTRAKGWRITEELRSAGDGTGFVFRAIHLREPDPGLEVCVVVDREGRAV